MTDLPEAVERQLLEKAIRLACEECPRSYHGCRYDSGIPWEYTYTDCPDVTAVFDRLAEEWEEENGDKEDI